MATAGTAHRIAAAMTARDFEALRELLADDVVLNSPITASFQFRGREEIIELLEVVRETYETLEYTAVFGEGDTWAQVFRARVRGEEMEGADVMRLDPSGKVSEFTVFFRPLPGLATLAGALAPSLAPTRGRRRLIAMLSAPLGPMTRFGDRIVPRILGNRRSR